MSVKVFINIVRVAVAGICFALMASASQAARIAIFPDNEEAITGATANFSLTASDFDLGIGGLTISFDDTLLTYNNDFTFAPSAGGGDAETAALGSPGALNITIGNSNPLAPAIDYPLAPPTLIGTFSFTMGGALGDSSRLTMADYLGGFYGFDNAYIPMTYQDAEAINGLPVPAAVWLFSSGLIGLIGIARRKKS